MWLLRGELAKREAYALKLSQGGEQFGHQGRYSRVFWNGYLRALQALESNGL